jgi:hypothetical protein
MPIGLSINIWTFKEVSTLNVSYRPLTSSTFRCMHRVIYYCLATISTTSWIHLFVSCMRFAVHNRFACLIYPLLTRPNRSNDFLSLPLDVSLFSEGTRGDCKSSRECKSSRGSSRSVYASSKICTGDLNSRDFRSPLRWKHSLHCR